MTLFCDHTKSPNTTQIGVSAGTGKPKMALLVSKSILGTGLEKGLYYLWYTNAENTILTMFSAKHSFANVCFFFEANSPNIPFLKPKLLSFLLVSFSSVVFILVYIFMFLPFCFYFGFVFGMFFSCVSV